MRIKQVLRIEKRSMLDAACRTELFDKSLVPTEGSSESVSDLTLEQLEEMKDAAQQLSESAANLTQTICDEIDSRDNGGDVGDG